MYIILYYACSALWAAGLALYKFPSLLQRHINFDVRVIPSASAHSLCVIVRCMSLCQCPFVCGRHSVFDVCFTFVFILDVTKRRGVRAREAIPTASSRYHHKRNEIKENICLWLVCCCLLPTCYFHRLFTSTWGCQRESGWFPPRSSVKVRARIVKLFIFWYFMSKVAPFHSHVCVCVCVCWG